MATRYNPITNKWDSKPGPQPRISREVILKVRELRVQGETFQSIAAVFGLSVTTVFNITNLITYATIVSPWDDELRVYKRKRK